MGEFFILAKFQGKNIASYVAKEIWIMHPGKWEVLVIPENKPALSFWRKTISASTNNNYTEEVKTIDYDKIQPERYIFNFDINLT
jgi:predicted acetyltransferase